jgi:hypothetical protein
VASIRGAKWGFLRRITERMRQGSAAQTNRRETGFERALGCCLSRSRVLFLGMPK